MKLEEVSLTSYSVILQWQIKLSYDSTERLKGTAENRIQSKIVKIRMF